MAFPSKLGSGLSHFFVILASLSEMSTSGKAALDEELVPPPLVWLELDPMGTLEEGRLPEEKKPLLILVELEKIGPELGFSGMSFGPLSLEHALRDRAVKPIIDKYLTLFKIFFKINT